MESVMILGRLPALSLAELESLYGADKVQPIGERAAKVAVDPCLLAFDRLGGSIKFCKLLTVMDTTNWKDIEKFLVQVSPGHSQRMPEGKMRLGLSAIGLRVSTGQLEATGLTMKKAIRKTGRNVRLVPNKELELNTAQVIHNQLTGPTGWELVFVADGDKTVIAQTVKVQDIDNYTLRDRLRPKRDARVGMLPPKLAQTIINLAAGPLPEDTLQNICDIPVGEPIPPKLLNKTVLDPFCGTGVILQEALLMGYGAYGSDLEKRMVDYSRANLEWLSTKLPYEATARLEAGDATAHDWQHQIDLVASESYLGRPFTSAPSPDVLQQTASECNVIIKKFLQNIHGQLKSGTRLCIAVPAWLSTTGGPNMSRLDEVQGASEARSEPYKQYGERALENATQQFAKSSRRVAGSAGKQVAAPRYVRHLPLIDQISDLGYNRVEFERVSDSDLLYYREDQVVARQLLVLTRK